MVRYRNDALGPRGISVGGAYIFVDPGETIEVDNPQTVADGLVRTSAPDDPAVEIPPVPAALKAKAAKVGKATAKKPTRRTSTRRTKAGK